MATRIRRDVYKLADWDPTLEWYAKAVREMRTRALDNPRSWRYQAAIHEFNRVGTPAADAGTYWNQCQHGSWFFLPWHRWYLLYFEEIVAKTIVDLGGPADWSLPYWNYSEDLAVNPNARILPKAFRDLKMPDGSDNPLHVKERSAAANGGRDVTGDLGVSLDCLKERQFQSVGPDGFGSPKTGFHHNAGAINATAVEFTPHGSIHGAVGGGTGFMSRFDTAGLDPIFWLHHCNIDRLWEVWRKRDSSHVNPSDAAWLTAVSFPFHTDSSTVVKTSAAAVDTVALGYEYEDDSDPIAAGVTPAVAATAAGKRAMDEKQEAAAELVGAADAPVQLKTTPTSTEVAVSAPSGPTVASSRNQARRVYVSLENVTGEGVAMNYRVYVNEQLVGLLALFGVAEASRASDRHGGGGIDVRYDVTDLVRGTGADLTTLKVTFVPEIDEEEIARFATVAGTGGGEPEFKVGRVSVYVA